MQSHEGDKSRLTPRVLLSAVSAARWQALRAWLWFVGSLAVLLQLLVWARPFTDTKLCAWLASASAVILRVIGAEGQAQGTTLASSLGTVSIVRECTGVYPTAMYVAAVLAYPSTWPRKFLGIGLGVFAIQVVNVIRILTLLYIQRWWPASFETAHLVVWQSLMVFLIVLFWIVWAVQMGESRKRHAA